MKEIHPQQTIFYAIEQAIKEYRNYAQNQISKTVSNYTF
jgi:hypothetical protein